MAKLHFRPYIPNQTVLFPQRIDENIAATDPVRIVNAVIDNLNLESFKKLYKETGRCPYHPKMMLKVIIYAYMNNIYSCRKIEKHRLSRFLVGIIFYTHEALLTSHYEKRLFEHAGQPCVAGADIRLLSYLKS
ncbi:hypothetical protein K330107F9_08350 [Bacteroides stercoris]